MAPPVYREAALNVARQAADELIASGADAVVLMGSFARGDAHPDSDIDLYALGEGPAYRLERREPFLISVSYRTPAAVREGFGLPGEAFALVPAWRGAVILRDPHGRAADVQAAARLWTPGDLDQASCKRWVAEEIAGFAEEAHKLVIHRAPGHELTLAANRSILALRLAVPLAVYHRLHYETENDLWELVGGAMGQRWASAQARALGLDGESLDESIDAALEMYALACRTVAPVFDSRQLAVVAHACRIAGHPLEAIELEAIEKEQP